MIDEENEESNISHVLENICIRCLKAKVEWFMHVRGLFWIRIDVTLLKA